MTLNSQFQAISPGLLLLVNSGLHMPWNTWSTGSIERHGFKYVFHRIAAWYIGCIVGSVIGAILVRRVQKKTIYYSSAIIYIVSSCIIVYALYGINRQINESGILAGRIVAGIAHGLIYITILIHASENAPTAMRGRVVSFINVAMTLPIFLASPMNFIISYDIARFITSIIAFLLPVVAVLLIPCVTIETAAHLLLQGKEHKALVHLKKLRVNVAATTTTTDAEDTMAIENDLIQAKLLIGQDRKSSLFTSRNGRNVLLMAGIRVMAVLGNNIIINTMMMIFLCTVSQPGKYEVPTLLILSPTVRFIAACLSLNSIDTSSRKTLLVTAGGVIGITSLCLGFFPPYDTENIPIKIFNCLLLIFVQMLSSFALEPVQHTFVAEAFLFNWKPWLITAATTIEYLAQLLFAGSLPMFMLQRRYTLAVKLYMLGAGISMMFLAVIFHRILPETKRLSMVECSNAYRKKEIVMLIGEMRSIR